MTLNTTINTVSYDGDGASVNFPVPYQFFGNTELEVIERNLTTGVETTKVLTTDYTVTGGAGAIGTVIAVTAPPTGVSWTIVRDTTKTQATDYTDNDPFPAETHETALDRATMLAQDADSDVARALKFPKTDAATLDATLPSSILRAGKHMAFDAAGEPTPGVAITTLTATRFLDTFTGNGSQTAFALSGTPASAGATDVYLEGLRQEPTTDYSVSGTTLTFVVAPPNLDVVIAAFGETFAGVPTDGSVSTAKIADDAVTLAKVAHRTRGDLFSYGASGVPQVLAVGTAGQVPTSDGTDPAYADVPLPRSFIDGFKVTNNTIDGQQDVDISIGAARDAADTLNLKTTAGFGKQADVAFAKGGTPAATVGGLGNTVTLPTSGTIHIHLITEDATGDEDFYFDTSITGANVPTGGWTFRRRVGSLITNAVPEFVTVAVLDWSGGAVEILINNPPLDVSISNLSTTAQLLTLSVPGGLKVQAIFNTFGTKGAAAFLIYLSSTDIADEPPSRTAAPLMQLQENSGVTLDSAQKMSMRTDASSQIRARAGNASTTFRIATLGWVDERV